MDESLSLLEDFRQYNATKPAEVINSTSKDSAKMWVRKAAFMQLGIALSLYEGNLTPLQEQALKKFEDHIYSPDFSEKKLTEKSDIELALQTLEAFNIDVSKQRAELATWTQ